MSMLDNSRFRRRLLRFHMLQGGIKTIVFCGIGALFVDVAAAGPSRLFCVGIGVGALALIIEYFWLFRPAIRQHEALRQALGAEYESELAIAEQTLGLRRLISSVWIAKRHDGYFHK